MSRTYCPLFCSLPYSLLSLSFLFAFNQAAALSSAVFSTVQLKVSTQQRTPKRLWLATVCFVLCEFAAAGLALSGALARRVVVVAPDHISHFLLLSFVSLVVVFSCLLTFYCCSCTQHPSPYVRQAAIYGIGMCAQFGGQTFQQFMQSTLAAYIT